MSKQTIWPHSLMWYTAPAEEWKQGLPVGNGTLAAMVLGRVGIERIALNHEKLWRGKGRGRTIDACHQHLPEIRKLFFEGKLAEAGALANEKLGGNGGIVRMERPTRVDPYQPAGDLIIKTRQDLPADYRRELDLDRALATVSYRQGSKRYRREVIAHSTLPVLAVRLSGENGAAWVGEVTLRRTDDPECEITPIGDGEVFGFSGRFVEGIRFAVLGRIITDGKTAPVRNAPASMAIDASEALVLLSIAVDWDDGDAEAACRRQLADVPTEWDALLASHVAGHQEFYRRARLEIGEERLDVPTNERVALLHEGQDDDGLLTLFANFGRYLLISSSRPGGLPANLQGKWNEQLNPPWQSDLHNDINIQMNYWPAEVFGLAECAGPLFDYIERAVPGGREIAQKLYGCRGVYMPIQTDIWSCPTPEANGYDIWVGGAAWLSQHLWWRWEYGRDEDFLREHAYPYLKDVAAFFEDYLVTDPRNGYLVPVPSQSPENYFVGGTKPVSLCVGATMDIELIQDVLNHAIEATEILGVDADKCDQWRDILAKLLPLQVGKHGQLQEWMEDYEECEPYHRHISHLYALFPGDGITREATPELFRAAEVSLDRRLSHKKGYTGWIRAWTACCMARLGRGDDARHYLCYLVGTSLSNFLHCGMNDYIPVDGNFGGAAGVCEMLLQSHGGKIHLLPALPEKWADGKVAGLHARGGFVVSITWSGGRPKEASFHSKYGLPCIVQGVGVAAATVTCDGETVDVKKRSDDCVAFDTVAGKNYVIVW